MPDEKQKPRIAEFVAMVCFVGMVVGIGYTGYKFSLDFLHGRLKEMHEYGRLAALVIGPYLAGLIAVVAYFRFRE